MILDAAQHVAIQKTKPTISEHHPVLRVLQIETQDTLLDVLTALRSQEHPIVLHLPETGEIFRDTEHFLAVTHLLAERRHPPYLCLSIPPHRRDIVALATTSGIPYTSSIEDAIYAFEHTVRAHVTTASSFNASQSLLRMETGEEERSSGEEPSPYRMLKAPPSPLRRSQMALLLVVSALLLSVTLLVPLHLAPPPTPAPAIVPLGTFSFESSGQFNPTLTEGYNDIVTLSLRSIPAPPKGFSYDAWLLPDPSDDSTVPLLLGSLHPGPVNLISTSPDHTNLLASYSGVRVTIQPENSTPDTPSQDPKMWKWQGFIPTVPTPGDENQYSLLAHLRHLLATDPTLQENTIPGGLVLWLTRNVSKIDEWAGSAQSDWHGLQTSSGDAAQLHRQLLRVLEYLDGIFSYERDVPVGSPWIVDPLAGKIGLLDSVPNQQPPGFLAHVDIHLTGLANAPGHTQQQHQLAIMIQRVLARMNTDLQQVRKDAVTLVKMNTAHLRQRSNQALLDEMMNLTSEVKSGWLDPQTGEDVGGVLWITSRLQQLASVPVS
jgi:hypothetical protein